MQALIANWFVVGINFNQIMSLTRVRLENCDKFDEKYD